MTSVMASLLLERFVATLDNSEAGLLAAVMYSSASDAERLGASPARGVLTESEYGVFADVLDRCRRLDQQVGLRSITVVMKATRRCNLRCSYCNSWRDDTPHSDMDFRTLCEAVVGALTLPRLASIDFVWHGGEVSLLDVDFFRKVVWLQQNVRHSARVRNSIQTNAVHIDPHLFTFFRDHDFAVGISFDGTATVHDRQRVNAAGQPTSTLVRRGIERLQALEVSFAALAVISEATLLVGVEAFLQSLLDAGISNVGLLNVIPPNGKETTSINAIHWDRYIEFLCKVYDLWNRQYRELLVIREFDALAAKLQGRPAGLCYFAGDCMGKYVTVEPDGTVAACDKYVGDADYNFGRLVDAPFSTLLQESENLSLAQSWTSNWRDEVADCPWHQVCNGGCPHDARLRKISASKGGCCGYAPLLALMERSPHCDSDAVPRGGDNVREAGHHDHSPSTKRHV